MRTSFLALFLIVLPSCGLFSKFDPDLLKDSGPPDAGSATDGGDTDADGDGDTDSDGDGDNDSDGDTDTDADSDTDSDADTDSDTDGDVDTDVDTDADTDADTDSDGDTDADADPCGSAFQIHQPGTNLCWHRCPYYQEWNGTACEGEVRLLSIGSNPSYTWCQQLYGSTNWRLPTLQEVAVLLDNCDDNVLNNQVGTCNSCDTSTTCSNMFGNDGNIYWTSTIPSITTYLIVDFSTGQVTKASTASQHVMRCVRDI